MPQFVPPAPSVETDLGRELSDICKICKYACMPDEHIHAALLGRIGVCASCWGKPAANPLVGYTEKTAQAGCDTAE